MREVNALSGSKEVPIRFLCTYVVSSKNFVPALGMKSDVLVLFRTTAYALVLHSEHKYYKSATGTGGFFGPRFQMGQ